MEKKKHGKHKYLGSYVQNLSGEIEYTGVYLKIDVPEEDLKRIKVWCAVMAGSIAVLFALAGLTNASSSRVMYVMLPYVATLLPVVFMLADVYHIVRYQKPLTLKQYDHSVLQLKAVTVATIALTAISAVGDTVYISFFCADENIVRELLYLAACIGMTAVSIALLMVQRKIICVECGK
jgi:hypothetical protein